MILDLFNLNKQQQNQLDKIYNENKDNLEKIFFNLINKDKKNFLVFSFLISRNPEENNLYYKICVLKLIEYYAKKKILKKVIANNYIFKNYIQKNFNNINVEIEENNQILLIENFIKFFKNIFFLIKLYFLKSNKRKYNFINKKKLILLDIFLIKSMFKNNYFVNRYYSNYLSKLNYEQKQRLFFFPIFFNNSLSLKNIKIFSKNRNFILHTDFLNLFDLAKILLIFIKSHFYRAPRLNYKNLELQHLINYEIQAKSFNHSFLISILTYFVLKNLKKSGANISTFVDWFENQIVDKSIFYSFSKFFPQTKLKAYMGLNSDLSINNHLIPTKLEKKNNLTANEIFLVNTDHKKYFKKVFDDKKIKIAPAFRNQTIYHYAKRKNHKTKNSKILVVFTGSHLDNLKMIETLNSLSKKVCKKFYFILRFHQNSEIRKLIPSINTKIKFKVSKYDSIYDLLCISRCVICRPSTISLEAEIFNVPVILTRRIFNLMPTQVNSSLKKNLCYENTEVDKKLMKLAKKFRNKTFFNLKLAQKYFAKYNLNKTLNLIS
tara:strand:- start:2490 stop:4133 length:1644 start_codon:yes stop_codon:yes gene_type:complete